MVTNGKDSSEINLVGACLKDIERKSFLGHEGVLDLTSIIHGDGCLDLLTPQGNPVLSSLALSYIQDNPTVAKTYGTLVSSNGDSSSVALQETYRRHNLTPAYIARLWEYFSGGDQRSVPTPVYSLVWPALAPAEIYRRGKETIPFSKETIRTIDNHVEELWAMYTIVDARTRFAQKYLLEANLSLVVHIAQRKRTDVPILERIQAGNLGLIRATEKFDYRRGYHFITYATRWVSQSIDPGIEESLGLIHHTSFIHKRTKMHGSVERRMTQRLNRLPRREELLAMVATMECKNFSVQNAEEVLRVGSTISHMPSLDARLTEESDSTLGTIIRALTLKLSVKNGNDRRWCERHLRC